MGGARERGFIQRLANAGVLPTDPAEERLRKATLTLSAGLITPLAVVWVATYWALGLYLSAIIPLAYQVVALASLVFFVRTKRYRAFRLSQLLLMLLLPFLLQWSLGGFVASSGVMLWAVLAPLGALMFQGPRPAVWWVLAFLTLTGLSGVIDTQVASQAHRIPEAVIVTFFVLNIGAVSGTTFGLLRYFVRERERIHAELEVERAKSERLLLNVLPPPIAARLKEEVGVIADGFEDASVLFADIVGFTPLAERMPPQQVVSLLDEVFSVFDGLAGAHGLEKIKTIGDAYMVAGGIPEPRPDHAEAVADMALAMRDECVRLAERTGTGLTVRVGMDTGPVTAGVIGRSKFIYDLWGDTVNTASRMESHGLPGEIQVTERVHRRLRDRFELRPRGRVEIKGKGPMDTYLLVARRAVSATAG
jgi:adenylate cyclase